MGIFGLIVYQSMIIVRRVAENWTGAPLLPGAHRLTHHRMWLSEELGFLHRCAIIYLPLREVARNGFDIRKSGAPYGRRQNHTDADGRTWARKKDVVTAPRRKSPIQESVNKFHGVRFARATHVAIRHWALRGNSGRYRG